MSRKRNRVECTVDRSADPNRDVCVDTLMARAAGRKDCGRFGETATDDPGAWRDPRVEQFLVELGLSDPADYATRG